VGNTPFTLGAAGGNDTINFAGGAIGSDSLANFDADPTGGQDLIDLRIFGITSASYSTSVTAVQSGANTMVTVDVGGVLGTIRLNGINVALIDETDFILG
jgi:hypothetical protein